MKRVVGGRWKGDFGHDLPDGPSLENVFWTGFTEKEKQGRLRRCRRAAERLPQSRVSRPPAPVEQPAHHVTEEESDADYDEEIHSVSYQNECPKSGERNSQSTG
jgi:hypothetical protein